MTQVLGLLMYEIQCGANRTSRKQTHPNNFKAWYNLEKAGETVAWAEAYLVTLDTGAGPSPEIKYSHRWLPIFPWSNKCSYKDYFRIIPLLFLHCTQVVHHVIPIPDSRICTPICLLPQKRWEVVEHEVREKLQLGVIEQAQSE